MRKAGKEVKMKEMKKKKMKNKRIGIANKAKLERKWNSNTPLRRGQRPSESSSEEGWWEEIEEGFTAGATILLPHFS